MEAIVIRRANEYDANIIANLEIESSASPWSEESIRKDILNSEGAIVLLAEIEDDVAGYADAWLVADELQLNNIAVFKKYHRRGIANQLLSKLIEEGQEKGCNSINLEVRVGNEPARNLYDKFGFQIDGIRNNYYEDNGEDAVLMSRDI